MNAAKRAIAKISRETLKVFGIDAISGTRVSRMQNLEKIGSVYGGWVIPTDLIDRKSICYCAGAGEDISFDIGLIERYGCTVRTFDPTPRAIRYFEENFKDHPSLRFYAVGLWDKDEVLKFYVPRAPEHVSHSILNLQKTSDYFEGPCKRLRSIMATNGHSRLDLLKLDIEGAEYRVIDSIIEDRLEIRVICVEYDEANQPLDDQYKNRISESLKKLIRFGYSLVAIDGNCNFTLVKNDAVNS